MYKPVILAFIATLILAFPAAAQGNMSPVGPLPTTFQIQAAPLNVLLNDGWLVQSMTGGEGEILLLTKGAKFIRCHLSGPTGSRIRLELAGPVFSTCHALN